MIKYTLVLMYQLMYQAVLLTLIGFVSFYFFIFPDFKSEILRSRPEKLGTDLVERSPAPPGVAGAINHSHPTSEAKEW